MTLFSRPRQRHQKLADLDVLNRVLVSRKFPLVNTNDKDVLTREPFGALE